MLVTMEDKPKRVTVYVDPHLHKALRLKAAETEQSYSARSTKPCGKASPRMPRT